MDEYDKYFENLDDLNQLNKNTTKEKKCCTNQKNYLIDHRANHSS